MAAPNLRLVNGGAEQASAGTDLLDLRQHVDTRLQGLKTDRWSWWTHWMELSRYLLPRRGRYLITPNSGYRGSPINQRIIDSTSTLALRTLSSGMLAGITSPGRPWFRVTLRDKDLADYTPVKLWLDDVRWRLLEVFAESNFYNAMAVLYEELGCFGTALMLIYEDSEDVIRCYNPTAGEYFLAQNYRYAVDTAYREFTLTVRQVAQQFGLDNCSESVKSLLGHQGRNQPDKEILIGHAIEPNDKQIEGAWGPKGSPFRQVYWELGSSENKILQLRPFYELPFIAPRWHIVGNDVYGRSPGMDALGDAKQLQVEQKRKAEAIEKQVRPPLIADIQLKNQPQANLPGGVTYIAGMASEGKVGMRPVYEVQPNLDELVKDLKEIQERIKEVFFYDIFLMISQLDTVRTATEIIERKQEKLLMLGPVLERFEDEALGPAIERTFQIMLRRGLIPPAPPELRGVQLHVQYTSMLSEAQKAVQTTGIERLYAFAGSLAAVKPEILDRLNVDETVDEYNEMLGNSPKVLIPLQEAQAMRAERAKQQQMQMALQEGVALTEGAKNMSGVDVGGGQGAVDAMINGLTRPGSGGNFGQA